MFDINVDIDFRRNEFHLDANFSLSKSQVTVILGASGCGKSSLLRLLAGLEKPELGSIQCHGETWFDSAKRINKPVQQRSVGFVFQDYALFENMTVIENMGFGVDKRQRNETVNELLKKLDLVHVQHQYPSQLSGGQKQRVALGRALAIKPKLLLLDEPLSAIDYTLRKQLQRELKEYIKTIDCPVILVTHDLEEARLMADKLIVMSDGKITRQGSAATVFNNPVNKQTANTLGWQNFLPLKSSRKGFVTTHWGGLRVDTDFIPGAQWVAIKPEKIRFGKKMENSLGARIVEIYDFGMYKEYRCQVDDSLMLIVHRPVDEPAPAINSVVNLHLSSQALMLITANDKTVNNIVDACSAQIAIAHRI